MTSPWSAPKSAGLLAPLIEPPSFEFLPPVSPQRALDCLSPTVANWFTQRFGSPTPIQARAWAALLRHRFSDSQQADPFRTGGHCRPALRTSLAKLDERRRVGSVPPLAPLCDGQSLLLSAPTGTGKTLAAFVPVLDQLLHEESQPTLESNASVRCLYLAPLKALCNDTLATLERVLEELGSVGTTHPSSCRRQTAEHRPAPPSTPAANPGLRVGVRTGDTAGEERRLQRTDPPEILLTTPESLAILLSQPEWTGQGSPLAHLRWVIIDEIHALAGCKRGADLSLSLERLHSPGGGVLQRIGLSATATPLSTMAHYLAGCERSESLCERSESLCERSESLCERSESLCERSESLCERPCQIAQVSTTQPMQLRITPLPREGSFLAKLVEQLVGVLVPSPTSGASSPPRSTLIFTNTRSLAERLSWALRRALPAWDDRIAVHHSALAAHRRQEVEQRFKRGEMRVVVCSTSLELGIDIGTVDLVVLVHPPGDVVRLLQRIGRSGHGPEGIRAGLVFTDTPAELLEASVTSASGMAGQCEPICPPEHPLDVLCQQLVGMAMAGPWSADEAYTLVRQAMPYRNLSRGDLDDCLRYLLGGSDPSVCTEETEQTSWLPARLRRVRESHGGSPAPSCGRFTILDRRTARLMRQNLGTILDNETVSVHLCVTHTPEDSRGREDETSFTDGQLIGEVDQAFADRLDPGDRFLLDGRCLQFRRREQGVIVVDEVLGRPRPPRWAGEGWPLSAALAQRLYLLRVQASEALRESPATLDRLLQEDYGLEGPALAQLRTHFERQETVSEIPDPSCLLVELTRSPGHVDQTTLYIHTPLNRPGNDALARVAMLRLARDHGRSATSLVADLGLALEIRGEVADPPGYVRALLAPGQFAEDLDQALSESIALRERFGRVARTGLMLLRDPQGNGRRVGGRSWGERELFGRLRMRDPDFVLLRQSLREIRADLCDAQQAQAWLEVLVSLPIRCRWLAHVSPFAQAWTQLEAGPLAQATAHYEQDDAHIEALERLHALLTGGEHAGAE